MFTVYIKNRGQDINRAEKSGGIALRFVLYCYLMFNSDIVCSASLDRFEHFKDKLCAQPETLAELITICEIGEVDFH